MLYGYNMTKSTNDYRDISTLYNWSQNPRAIKKDKFQELKNRIKRHGQFKPLIITPDGEVLGGNMRLRAFQELGIKEAWVSVVTPKTEAEKIEIALTDNEEMGYYEDQALAELIAQYKDEIDLTKYSVHLSQPKTLDEILRELSPDEVVEDEAPEVAEEAVSELGKVYQLGRHRVMCGDSTKVKDVEKLMDGKKAELLFTSPPYSDMREYEGGKDLSVGNLIKFIPTYRPFCEYQVINLGIQRKEQEIVEYWNDYIKLAKDSGYKFLAWNVWNKTTVSIGQQKAFIPIYHEWIFVFGNGFKEINRTEQRKTPIRKENGTTRRQADGSVKFSSIGKQENLKSIDSVFTSNSELGEIRKDHPATFPVELPAKYIKAITDFEDNVIDPFLGSGSTLIACEQTNRTCYGMELDPRYTDVIRKRYAKFIDPDDWEDNWQSMTPETGK